MNYLVIGWLLVAFLIITTSLIRAPQIGSANSLQVNSENKFIDQLLVIFVFLFFLFGVLIGIQNK